MPAVALWLPLYHQLLPTSSNASAVSPTTTHPKSIDPVPLSHNLHYGNFWGLPDDTENTELQVSASELDSHA